MKSLRWDQIEDRLHSSIRPQYLYFSHNYRHACTYIYNTHKEVHLLSSSCLLIPLIHPDVLTHPHLQHKSPATPSNTHTGLNVPHKRRQVNYITQRQFVSEPLTLIFDLVTGEQSVCEAGSRGIISWVINHKA